MVDSERARDLLPRGEALKKAIRWIGERRRDEPGVPFFRLVDEAGRRFDLSPSEEEFLQRNFAGRPAEE